MSNSSKNNALLKSSDKNIDKRNISLKWFSIGSVIILIAIVLVVDILFDAILGDKFVFDMSSTGQHTVSQTTEDYLASLPADTHIRIVGLFEEPENIAGTSLEYVCPLLEDYAEKSDGKVTVEYIDPASHPGIISELDPEGIAGLEQNQFAVYYNGKVQSVTAYDCFAVDQTTGYATANVCEATFTNAIYTLVNGYSYKAYFITGLQEPTHLQLSKVLASIGIESAELPASTVFAIPEDCDLLIINGINSDISEGMADAIKEYLYNGGDMLLAVNYYQNATEYFTNLNDAISVMGIAIDPYMLLENDADMVLYNGLYNQSLVTVASPFDELAVSPTARVSYCRTVRPIDNGTSQASAYAILQSSELATSTQGYDTNVSFADQGVHNVGMYCTFTGSDNAPRLYAFGTTDLTSDDYISTFGYNDSNVVLMRNILRSMFPTENTVLVPSKAMADYSLDPTKVTQSSVNVLTVVLMIIIPLGLVAVGTIVYNKRKNL